MFGIIAIILSVVLAIECIYFAKATFRCKTKFQTTLTISFACCVLAPICVSLSIPILFPIIRTVVFLVGNWVLLTVYAYRRPIVRLRVYEFTVLSWICLILLFLPEVVPFLTGLIWMSAHGLVLASFVNKNSADEFAIGITTRERRNPFYLRLYKKIEFEEVYIPPSLVGNKDIQQTTDWHRKGCFSFAAVHTLGILEILSLFIGLPNLALCIEIARLGFYQVVCFFGLKITQ
eukprot:NODE_128_length_17019_cov_0.764480.p11 type:complete len:233 gc:universal NODE_128_length_17019_cov_0.764480:3131-2433(-)